METPNIRMKCIHECTAKGVRHYSTELLNIIFISGCNAYESVGSGGLPSKHDNNNNKNAKQHR